jgi:hypothetical protein
MSDRAVYAGIWQEQVAFDDDDQEDDEDDDDDDDDGALDSVSSLTYSSPQVCNILLYLFTKHIHKTKHRVTRTPYKPGMN